MAIQSLFGTPAPQDNPSLGEQSTSAKAPSTGGLLDRLKAGIQKTRAGLMEKIEDAVSGRKEIDADVLEELEYALITADIGSRTTSEILERIRQRVERHLVGDTSQLKSLIKEHLLEILEATERPLTQVSTPPAVIMVVGVNGAGKTTSIGKLTRRLQSEGKSVLLCAADTFRAAAIEQLEVWAQRTGAEIIKQQQGADPSAVAFDAMQAARARKVDCIIIDTAGRLHTKTNLMAELEKMRRTVQRVIPEAPHEVLLVLEATTGQNGLEQARKFTETSAVTGIILTKLDGTAKGGVVVAISRELNLPIRYIGVGEQIDDLLPFDPQQFVTSLFD
ncbi:MAG: signal recognition particle-docking protein FtsY [Bryobacteraceae bacterium]